MSRAVDPEEMARWLLRHAVLGDESPAVLVAAARSVYSQLRTSLSIFFGQTGFDALWARALSDVLPSVLEHTAQDAQVVDASTWLDALGGRNIDEIHAVTTAALTSFISLLFAFVGPEIGYRLLEQAWPALLMHAPGTSTGDTIA